MLQKIIPIILQPSSAPPSKKLNLDLNQVCMDCGACCSYFRVSFYFGELASMPSGFVPDQHTNQLNAHMCSMNGTDYALGQASQRCDCLEGKVGTQTKCTIYDSRPTPCREFNPYDELGIPDERCNKARLHHGLPELKSVAIV